MSSSDAAGDEAERQDELLSLEAIYSDDVAINHDTLTIEAGFGRVGNEVGLTCTVHLPTGYPSRLAPLLELSGIAPEDAEQLHSELLGLFAPGQPVIYDWIEHLRERFGWGCEEPTQSADEPSRDDDLPAEERSFNGEVLAPQMSPEEEALALELAAISGRIVSGEPFTERRSTFQAHLCPVNSRREVDLVKHVLLQHNKIRNATHNMMAFRIWQPEMQTTLQDSDDDGEAAAGARLLFLLNAMSVQNVVVFVSRWFGGVLMGGQRFKEINRAAQGLLEQQGYDQRAHEQHGKQKHHK